MKEETKTLLVRVILLVILEGLLGVAFFPVFFIAALMGTSFYPLLIVIVFAILAASFPFFIFGVKFRKYALFFYLFSVIATSASIGIRALYRHFDDQVPVVYDGIDITDYQPFSKTLARLPGESSLKLTDSLPVLDGALALYPVYSAFATALYPQGDYSLRKQHERTGYQARYDGGMDTPEKKRHPVHFTNTVDGFEGLINDRVDIFFMAELSDAQKNLAKEKGIDLVFTPIGKEAFVFFVNRKNPVKTVTVEEIRKIYSGEITHWRELGGKGKIKAFQRNKNSGSQSALEHLMAGEKLIVPPTNERPGGMGGIIREVAAYKNYEGALGFSFRFFTTKMAKNHLIKLLEINGVAPTEENVRNGTYPIISTIYAITRRDNPNPNVQRMLDWMVSDQGQTLVRDTGYTPITGITTY